VARHEHNRHFRPAGADVRVEGDSIFAWEHHIEQNEVDSYARRAQDAECFIAVSRFQHPVATFGQHTVGSPANQIHVINYENGMALMHDQMLDRSARNNDAGAATVAPCETSPR
jgi:hypothetical protein